MVTSEGVLQVQEVMKELHISSSAGENFGSESQVPFVEGAPYLRVGVGLMKSDKNQENSYQLERPFCSHDNNSVTLLAPLYICFETPLVLYLQIYPLHLNYIKNKTYLINPPMFYYFFSIINSLNL